MSTKDYLKDIGEIKELMNKSSRFLSLSGLSGIFAGVYAILGAAGAYYFLFPKHGEVIYLYSWRFGYLVVVLAAVAFLSITTAMILTTKKAKEKGEKIWDDTTKRLLFNFLIPMVTGGIYILIKLQSQHYGLTASLMLIFYGLGLINASKYTLGTIKYLGMMQVVLGLICAAFPGKGFVFWVMGFGVLHIVYGTIMYFQERKEGELTK